MYIRNFKSEPEAGQDHRLAIEWTVDLWQLDQSAVVAADGGAGPRPQRGPAARPMPTGPECASAADHRQDKQQEKRVMSRPGPSDQEDNGGAGADADRETLQQRTAVLRLRQACPGRAGCQALINTCGDLLVNFLKERGHDRVAVLGA
jgi:hypothetical protein